MLYKRVARPSIIQPTFLTHYPVEMIALAKRNEKNPKFMTWDQAREMENYGIRFGNHTATHPHLDLISPEMARKEILDGKEKLSQELKNPSKIFCYPFGGYTLPIQRVVQECGYEGAVATSVDSVLPLADRYAFRRLKISDHANSNFIFAFEISGYYSVLQKVRKRIKSIKKKFLETSKGDAP